MRLKRYLVTLLLLLFWEMPVVGTENTKIEKLPPSGEAIIFPNHLLMKVSNRTNIFNYDNKTEQYIINFNNLIVNELKSIPSIFFNRIPAMTALKTDTIIFKNLIKNDYYFSSKWTDKKHIISIKDFIKTGTESDISAYLGPLSNIPTASHGLATFELKFEGSVVNFKTYAMKKIFSFKKQYWAFLAAYVPPKKYANQIRLLILIVSEPNNYLKDNGTYFLIPITEDDRKKYSINY